MEGREAEAIPRYEAAIERGSAGSRARQARIQLGNSLRNVGLAAEAVTVLEQAAGQYEVSSAAECFLALSLAYAGRHRKAVSTTY